MIRMLVVTTVSATIRGFLRPFADHFRRLGWQVDALASDVSGCAECIASFDSVWSVGWSRNPLSPLNLVRPPRDLERIVKSGEYDIVHVHTPVAAFVTRLALRTHKVKPVVIYTAHGFHFYKGNGRLRNALFQSLERIAAPWTDHLVVINREDETAALRLRLVPESRLWYMPGIGVDLEKFSPESVPDEDVRQFRSELGLGQTDKLFLMIAAFDSGKRHKDLVMALRTLHRPDVHLALAGDGPLRPELQRFARALSIEDRVHFLGWRPDVPVLIKASIATVLPSQREGLPRSVMEAMSMGALVIGADTRGTRELLADGRGILVPLADQACLAGALAWAIDKPLEAATIGARAREYMPDFDTSRIIAMHERLYAAALDR